MKTRRPASRSVNLEQWGEADVRLPLVTKRRQMPHVVFPQNCKVSLYDETVGRDVRHKIQNFKALIQCTEQSNDPFHVNRCLFSELQNMVKGMHSHHGEIDLWPWLRATVLTNLGHKFFGESDLKKKKKVDAYLRKRHLHNFACNFQEFMNLGFRISDLNKSS